MPRQLELRKSLKMQNSEKIWVGPREVAHQGKWLITYKRDFESEKDGKIHKGVWEYVGWPG